jgi:N-acetyl-alpha-D-muramate 1-phosphate uridylyltransferase
VGRIKHALIMAAGRGSRMMPLTQVLPKPMAPYLNTTLVANGIEKIRPHIENIHVTVGYKGAMLAQHLIEHGVSSVFNTDGQTNSWWLFNTLMCLVDAPVFVLTCDNVTDIDFAALEEDYFALGAPPCLLVPVAPVPGLEGDYIFHREQVVSEVSRTKPADIYCSGIQVINPARVNQLVSGRSDFYAVWNELIAKQQLWVSRTRPTRWFTVDTLEDLQRSAGG